MAEATAHDASHNGRRDVGRTLLALYLVVAVALIMLIWADNLSGNDPTTPGYVRDTYIVDESVYLTVTAEAAAVERTPATPTPTAVP